MAEQYNVVARVRREDLDGVDVRISSAYNGRELHLGFQDESRSNVVRALDATIAALKKARDRAASTSAPPRSP